MKKLLFLLFLLIPSFLYEYAPSKTYDFTSETTIRSAEVNSDFDEIYGYLSTGIDNIRTSGIDAISEIDSALRSGADQTLITGTEGGENQLGVWDVNGDLIGSGSQLLWTQASASLSVSNGTLTSRIVYIKGLDCTGNSNSGKITANAQGLLSCADDVGTGSAVGWTDDGTEVRLDTSTDEVEIGSAGTLSAKLAVNGDADEIQTLIQGNATQTSDILVVENSAGTDILTSAVGGVKVAGPLNVGTNVTLAQYDCSGLTNSGKLTANSAGRVYCMADSGGGTK